MNLKRLIPVLLLMALLLSACAAGANPNVDVAAPDGNVAGFWMGLWHGLIVPITFIISLFTDKVHMYEVHNTGGWYNFGFILGVMIIFGSGGGGAGRYTCSRR